MHDIVAITEHCKRKTVTVGDVSILFPLLNQVIILLMLAVYIGYLCTQEARNSGLGIRVYEKRGEEDYLRSRGIHTCLCEGVKGLVSAAGFEIDKIL